MIIKQIFFICMLLLLLNSALFAAKSIEEIKARKLEPICLKEFGLWNAKEREYYYYEKDAWEANDGYFMSDEERAPWEAEIKVLKDEYISCLHRMLDPLTKKFPLFEDLWRKIVSDYRVFIKKR